MRSCLWILTDTCSRGYFELAARKPNKQLPSLENKEPEFPYNSVN